MAKLLVVDDREVNRHLLEALLTGRGHQVRTAGNGAEALADARREPPDLVISEVLMPEMDGFALCRAWKRDPQLGGIPFIFHTATYADPQDETLALSLGAEGFVAEPAGADRFLDVLERVLAGGGGAGATRGAAPPEDEGVPLRQYNQTLIHRLEDRVVQLEAAIERLRREKGERGGLGGGRMPGEWECRALLEAVADPLIVYDEAGKVVYLNPAFTRVFGWTLREVAGLPLNLAPPEEGDEIRRRLNGALACEPFYGWEGRCLSKDHKLVDVHLSAACFRDEREAVRGIVVSLQDVTLKKRIEREREGARAQQIQAQKMEALATLAGGLAHDFNDLLAVMTGFAELALDSAQGREGVVRHLGQVIQAGERATSLVRKILTFSHHAPLDARPLDLNKEVARTAALLERTLPKMISVQTHLADELKPINGDPVELEQMLTNLAANAQDAMPQGGRLVFETANVTVEEGYSAAYLKVTPGDYVLLQVSDTGHGMDGHTREQVFDPFFTTKEAGKGRGLGLSTVFGIVKSHDGHISCYSELGHGTIFKVFLPVFREAQAGQARDSAPRRQPEGGDESILLVDDERLLLDLGETLLSRAGYKVTRAESGEEALAIYRLRQDSLDLVITDLAMPGMGGYKTLQAILEINPRAKVVIASGYTANSQVRSSLDAGAAGYVAKPFGRAELLNKIREVLDRS